MMDLEVVLDPTDSVFAYAPRDPFAMFREPEPGGKAVLNMTAFWKSYGHIRVGLDLDRPEDFDVLVSEIVAAGFHEFLHIYGNVISEPIRCNHDKSGMDDCWFCRLTDKLYGGKFRWFRYRPSSG